MSLPPSNRDKSKESEKADPKKGQSCPSCGTEFPDDVEFCTDCRLPLEETPDWSTRIFLALLCLIPAVFLMWGSYRIFFNDYRLAREDELFWVMLVYAIAHGLMYPCLIPLRKLLEKVAIHKKKLLYGSKLLLGIYLISLVGGLGFIQFGTEAEGTCIEVWTPPCSPELSVELTATAVAKPPGVWGIAETHYSAQITATAIDKLPTHEDRVKAWDDARSEWATRIALTPTPIPNKE
ncbi:MAG: hypothetical protein CL786_00020 [Chloroflexi bacterium]|nr:hypothetical protein [Chloroflexota bacterium]|tara:strand:- start:363 stop:1070 length:708 start_codon:yes stop_codon:yes gene_type:complete